MFVLSMSKLFSFVYYLFLFLFLLLMCNGDFKFNLGPKKNKNFSISWCHWNVNILLAHNCVKVTYLEVYNSAFRYDFICISETYLDPAISSKSNNLNILGYNLIRADHPSNSKRDYCCIHYRKSRAVQASNDIGWPDCLVCKVCLGNKTGYVLVGYRSRRKTN